MRLLEAAKKGIITKEMSEAAKNENMREEEMAGLIAKGKIVITKNKNHKKAKTTAIGEKTRVKVNANIGSSKDVCDVNNELEKLKAAEEAGADTVMDLSTGGDIKKIRKEILKQSKIPVGTVPIYETAVNVLESKGAMKEMTADDIFNTIEEHAAEGVDYVTVHCGITKNSVNALIENGRLLDVVSRGGSMLSAWILKNEKENPLFSDFGRLLEIASKYDMTLSLGDGMRPGCIADATDAAQITELITLGELASRAKEKNVQAMIEGPGHVPLNEIYENIRLQKKLCNGAPFYVLGPVVTDVAPGYDHITSAIGGALAGASGADFLCYVTPAEHLKLPDVKDVRAGVMVTRIAAHAADLAKGYPGAKEWDNKMALARKNLDWNTQLELAMDRPLAKKIRDSSRPADEQVCTMCGDLCAIKELKSLIHKKNKN